MSDISFENRTVIVTGAGNGLGKAYAIDLGNRGAKVVVNDLGGAVDGSGSGLDADTLDGISSASFLRSDTSDTFTGTLTVSGNILPNANGTRDLGASGTRWANIYSSDLDLSNQAKGANSVDGTWGSYLIEEGEEHLFLTNRRSGKKYRFVLLEV